MYEHLFEQVGKKAADGEVVAPGFEDHPDLRRTVEVAAEHGIEIPAARPPSSNDPGRHLIPL